MSIGSPDWAGTPAIDRLASVFTLSAQSIASGAAYASGVMNIAQYQSLQLYYRETNASYSGTAGRLVRFEFYADSGTSTLLDRYQLRIPAHGGTCYARLPVLGPYLQINIDSATTTSTSTIDLSLYGSYRSASSVRAFVTNSIVDTLTAVTYDITGSQLYFGTVPSGSYLSAYPPYWLGRMKCHLRTAPIATTACELVLLDLVGTTRLGGITVPVSASTAQYDFEAVLTGEAFELRFINNSSGSVLMTVAMNFEGLLR